jgi:hypothetical protein
MDTYTLQGEAFLHPTPAGAYFAVSHAERDLPGAFMLRLVQEPESPALTTALLQDWTGLAEPDALAFLYRLQEAGLVQGLPEPVSAPRANLESLLPGLLTALSLEGRAVLADTQGLALGSAGYSPEATEELAALAADVAALQARHAGLLDKHFRLGWQGWGIVSAAGYSELGCWPLHLGDYRFILVLHGEPRLNQPAFIQLVWALGVHYAR